ncbi:MAG: hypothetical protein KUG75_11010, partial [Pseudomonadales bacterium]|nr:hypothetical protein [Pseudomonadales bacterium]
MKHCLWLAVCLLCISSYGDSVAEFRLDELLWTGAEGEVIETQNGINGTASMNTTTEPKGLVCAAGDFSANSIHDMVFLDAGILNNKTEFSISVWVKTSNKSSQLIVSGANSSQANELLMRFPTSTTFAPILKGSSLQGVAIPDISDNDWHHLVWSRSNLDSCIYVDGAVIGCVSRNSEVVSIDPGGLILAQEQDKVGGSFDINQDFEGLIDELVIFDSALDAAEVETINKNNIAGLGWKGNVRNCIELAASWQFEEKAWDGTSGEVRDTSANSINGTSFNGPENTDKNPVFSTQPGTCRYGDFDGIDDYIQIAHDNALNGRDALTYSAWIYPTSWDGSIRQIMAKSVHGGGSGRAQMGLFSEGGVLKGRAETNLGRVEITTKLPSLNQWSHVALVFSGTSISLIVDGSSEGISNFSSRQLLSTTDPLNISKRVGTSQYYFAGAIDEVRVYTSALSQSHIQSIMNERHTCETPPVADWRFDSSGWNGTVDEVHDSSGNEFHGVAFDTNTTAGKICNAADFSANSTSDYLSMNRDALNGRSDFTIATWYKSSNQGATALLSGSNASRLNETIFWLYRSTAFGPHLLNSSGSGLNMPEIADGNWHFIVWTRLSSSNCLYVDDIFYGCVGRKAGPLSIDVGGLILGQEQDRVGGGFDIDQEIEGLLDEMLIFNRGLSAAQVSDIWKNHNAGFTWDGLARSCTELGAAQFLIAHDGHGINCLLETGTITALDANKKVVTGYVGQIILDTQTGHGTWSLKNGNGVLTDATLDDGRASYQFVASDQGSVNFALSYMQGSTPFDIEVYQNDDVSVRDDDSEGHMEFSPNGFTITSNILSNPPPNPISDPVGTQTAGSVFEIHIAAFGQTDTDPICGVIESYAGDKSLSFWMDYLDPNSGALSSTVDGTLVSVTEGAATAQKIAFVAGQAAVSVKYKDVGAIRLHLKDVVSAPAEIRGGSNAFVVRPADLRITRVQSSSGAVNPASTTATGSGFVA